MLVGKTARSVVVGWVVGVLARVRAKKQMRVLFDQAQGRLFGHLDRKKTTAGPLQTADKGLILRGPGEKGDGAKAPSLSFEVVCGTTEVVLFRTSTLNSRFVIKPRVPFDFAQGRLSTPFAALRSLRMTVP
jgi:hypothetical protein